ncbi:hypothetical protein [Acidovorax sp.]|uniref:hypothetical protein n=1 Tax=Acidovorax sp. TaxID=1872122 RepID=UPI00391FA43A
MIAIVAGAGSIVFASFAKDAQSERMDKIVYPQDLQDALSGQGAKEVILAAEKRNFRLTKGALEGAGVAALSGSTVLLGQLALESDEARRTFDFKGLLEDQQASRYLPEELRFLVEMQVHGAPVSDNARAFGASRAARHARASLASGGLAMLGVAAGMLALVAGLFTWAVARRVERISAMLKGLDEDGSKSSKAGPVPMTRDQRRRIALGPDAFLTRNHDDP